MEVALDSICTTWCMLQVLSIEWALSNRSLVHQGCEGCQTIYAQWCPCFHCHPELIHSVCLSSNTTRSLYSASISATFPLNHVGVTSSLLPWRCATSKLTLIRSPTRKLWYVDFGALRTRLTKRGWLSHKATISLLSASSSITRISTSPEDCRTRGVALRHSSRSVIGLGLVLIS